MRGRPTQLLLVSLLATLLAASRLPAYAPRDAARPLTEQSRAEIDQRIVHTLNRLAFGPRPGDVERVRRIGIHGWIEKQLRPEKIRDRATDRRLATLASLRMTPSELLVTYPPFSLIRSLGQYLSQRQGLGQHRIAELLPELGRDATSRDLAADGEVPGREARYLVGPRRIRTELTQAKLIRAIYSERQLQEVMTDFWFNHFNVFIGKGDGRWFVTAYERDVIRANALGRFRTLLGGVARHPAMLFYLDNWRNASPQTRFGRTDLQPYAWAAMRSQGLPPGGVGTLILRNRGMDTREVERAERRRQARRRRQATTRDADSAVPGSRQRYGLNENYARELLELHTLGVDGGYTQADVVEVARCFTGWTLVPANAGRGFTFVPELHDPGDKTVLGRRIPAGGLDEGEAVLDLLATHPATARFVSTKLARRFVSDVPPAALVERMSTSFLESGGDVRAVLRTMLSSDEFWSAEARGAKVKTPFELVVSALRAAEADIAALPRATSDRRRGMAQGSAGKNEALPGLFGEMHRLGQPLYAAQPPTGYAETADAWVSSGAMFNRMRFALRLVGDRISGVRVPLPVQKPDENTADHLNRLGRRMMGSQPNPGTIRAIAEQLDSPDGPRIRPPQARARLELAWLIASPEFQRR